MSAFGYFTATTDASDNFLILGVPAALGNIIVFAYRSAAGQTVGGSSASVSPVISGVTNAGTITLAQQTGVVSGVITNLSNQTVAGVQVAFRYPDSGTQVSTISDSVGRYQFSNIGGLTFSITAFDPQTGFTGQVTSRLSPGSEATGLNIIIGPVGTVKGVIYHVSEQSRNVRFSAKDFVL